ncbi:hypothetical protein BKA80DRAFT_273663 [Phyllosticta citrichinensis]
MERGRELYMPEYLLVAGLTRLRGRCLLYLAGFEGPPFTGAVSLTLKEVVSAGAEMGISPLVALVSLAFRLCWDGNIIWRVPVARAGSFSRMLALRRVGDGDRGFGSGSWSAPSDSFKALAKLIVSMSRGLSTGLFWSLRGCGAMLASSGEIGWQSNGAGLSSSSNTSGVGAASSRYCSAKALW